MPIFIVSWELGAGSVVLEAEELATAKQFSVHHDLILDHG
jgi:hypothetical protein